MQTFQDPDPNLFAWDTTAPGDGHVRKSCAKLMALFKRAGLLEISWEHLAHPGLEETGSRLKHAAAGFRLADDIGLEQWFWTNPRDLWEQRIARQFLRHQTLWKSSPPAHLCIYAQEASPNGLFWLSAGPLRCRDQLRGNFHAGGPFMALLVCQVDWSGHVQVTGGYVQPIHSSQLAFPVNNARERKVVETLLKVAERLDALGVDMKVSREAGRKGPADEIRISLSREGKILQDVAIISADHASKLGNEAYHITAAKLEDRTFLNWLAHLAQEK